MIKRRLAVVGSIGLLIAAGGGVALATGTRLGGNGRPKSLKPGGVRLSTTFGWGGLSRARQPIVTGFDLWFPKGSQYNGGRFPKCSQATLDRSGPSACPSGSVVGSGSGIAYASSTITRPKVTVVNGGGKDVFFYIVMNNPARVRQAVDGHLTRVSGKFAYHLSVKIPQDLQVVAGVPIKLTSLRITAGKGKWLAITQAPAGVQVATSYSTGFQTSYIVWVQNS